MKSLKTAIALVLYLAAMLLLFDVMSSYALIYYYRIKHVPNAVAKENGTLSSVVFAKLVANKLAHNIQHGTRYLQPNAESIPSPYFRSDPILGYSANPGKYSLIFKRTKEDVVANKPAVTEKLITKVTIENDGNRWLGNHAFQNGRPNIYIFGDSYIFGWGVNDEQSFPFLLQQNRNDLNFSLFANGGYSLVEAYINFERLKAQLKPDDILIVAYTAFYKRRDVAAPSLIVENGEPGSLSAADPSSIRRAQASVDNKGNIRINWVHEFCKFGGGYCKQPDPPPDEMNKVSASLINHIASESVARVYLLHFGGERDYYQQVPELHDPLPSMLDKRVEVIPALDDDFGSFVRDNVAGFDSHPGPYWHYAMFTKLKGILDKIIPRSDASARPKE